MSGRGRLDPAFFAGCGAGRINHLDLQSLGGVDWTLSFLLDAAQAETTQQIALVTACVAAYLSSCPKQEE